MIPMHVWASLPKGLWLGCWRVRSISGFIVVSIPQGVGAIAYLIEPLVDFTDVLIRANWVSLGPCIHREGHILRALMFLHVCV